MDGPMGVRRRSIRAAVLAQLTEIGKAGTPLGATALALAERLDSPDTADTAVAAVAKELRTTMAELTRGAPAVGDPVDDLRSRREQRRQREAHRDGA